MNIIVLVLVAIVIAVLLCAAVDRIPQIAPFNGLLCALILIGAALLIAHKAGLF